MERGFMAELTHISVRKSNVAFSFWTIMLVLQIDLLFGFFALLTDWCNQVADFFHLFM